MRIPIKHLFLAFALAAGMLSSSFCYPQMGMQLVANVPEINRLTQAQAIALFSANDRRWKQNGKHVKIVIYDDEDIHSEFSREVLDINPRTLKRAWNRRVYMGTGWQPIAVKSWQEMLDTIRREPGAIGYIPRELIIEDEAEGLSVITVVPE